MINFFISVLKIIFTMGFIIFVHELGHFLVAKKCGVYIKEFALGFGPKIFSKQGKETKYTLRAIPFGGYVNMLGEEEKVEDEKSFSQKKPWQRLLIIIAGATVNIILGILIYFFLSVGTGEYYTNQIQRVEQNYIAEQSGIEPGDIVEKINGKQIKSKTDIDSIVRNCNGKAVNIEIKRNNEILQFEIIPSKLEMTLEDGSNYELYFLGIVLEKAELSIGNRFYYSLLKTKAFIIDLGINVRMLFTGGVKANQMMGPVGISEVVAETSSITEFINFLALISVSLGISNLLPILPLDGGRAVLVIIEMIRKKTLKEDIELKLQEIGFIFIILLAIYISINDLIRIF